MDTPHQERASSPFQCSLSDAGTLSPCTIVIFGASGDLTARKLVPALFSLYRNNSLPHPFSIVGCGRTVLSAEAFRNSLRIPDKHTDHEWQSFAENIFYHPVQYDSAESFDSLAGFLQGLNATRNTGSNLLFYLAIPPALYATVAEGIGNGGMTGKSTDDGWTRIVVEKPFGRDLDTAMELDRTLHQHFLENQIFRIDHYLAKETVQNVLMLRFANAIFEPIWNRNYIDYIGIIAGEELGVEHRAGYYDHAGVLRDMFQNHMMQLLALTAMEPPSRFEANRVRDEKVKVYRSLRPFIAENLPEDLVLGQYGAGQIKGATVPAYREEKGVDPRSLTPTFAMMRLFIDNWRWQGVPFYLTSAKRMPVKTTRIVVQFKEVPHSMFRSVLGEHITANRLTLGVYPKEEISLSFQAKRPGSRVCLQPVNMAFEYGHTFQGPSLDAYEKVLLDCILGDHMLFWRQDGVELCWSFLSPILDACERCTDKAGQLKGYPAGSWGPAEAREWMSLIMGHEMHAGER